MINKTLRSLLKQTGKPVKWYQFAVKTKTGGWRFLRGKDAQWQALNQIAKIAAKKLPQYSEGQIVDRLAKLVNSPTPL